jgi:rhodanese-related sulfurtransferase
MKSLPTEELHKRVLAGPVALFDVRGDLEFAEGHIPGAKSAPLGSLVSRVARVMNPGSFVAVYSWGDDDLAEEAGRRLEDLGMTNVHVYEAGFSGWKYAGYPATAPDPTRQRQVPMRTRRLVIDRETALGGAFKGEPGSMPGATGG